MPRTLAHGLVALAITTVLIGTVVDAFAMGGSNSRKGGGNGGGNGGGGGEQNSSAAVHFSDGTNLDGIGTVNITSDQGINQVSAVPEPGTILLIASGLTGVAVWARRRKK